MRRKSLNEAKLVVTVESYKGKPMTPENPYLTIRTVSVFDNRTGEFWSKERIKERGIEYFSTVRNTQLECKW